MSEPLTVDVQVAEEGWGARAVDVRAVCLSVAECFSVATQIYPIERIWVEPDDPSRKPRTHYRRLPSGHVLVTLPARDRYWAQYAYQFAHEYCHVLCNIASEVPPEDVYPTDWIEESLCEMASLFALRTMARGWLDRPPYENWASYAPALESYATTCLASVPTNGDFAEWLQQTLPLLEVDRYRRADNARVAARFLPIFEADPSVWCAVRFLNLWSVRPANPPEYFESWRSVAPEPYRSAIRRIQRVIEP